MTFAFDGETACCGLTTYWASAYAVVESLVVPHPLRRGEDLQGVRLDREAMSGSDRLWHDIAQRMALLNHLTAHDRVIWFLRWISEHTGAAGSIIDVPMARRDVADFLGLTPETVSRALTRLEDEGRLIRKGAHSYELVHLRRRRAPAGIV